MIGLGENFDIILDQVEKVRTKELLYMVFRFQENNPKIYEIRESHENPNKNNKFIIKDEEELKRGFDIFQSNIKTHGCCYALFDFETNLEDGSSRSLLFLITLIPDEFNVKEKFLYSAHIQRVVENLKTSVKILQINKYEDLSYSRLKQVCLSLKKA
ncbi:cofilin [Nematocida displodere]|uniref:Cofilin n=1 Tax=Nematocida displodere TaxID=1805483 RepID=A0A177EFX9_9MICR|nr:cofilin [Nematocida displodere]